MDTTVVGSFSSPKLLICIEEFIRGLPKQLVIEGLVEVWKHLIISNNSFLYNNLIGFIEGDNFQLTKLVYESLLIKKEFVEQDPFDTNGIHKAVSLGHILANYLETYSNITHGQAVYCGIIFDSYLSFATNNITDQCCPTH